jgi:hypothetical protein
MQVFIIRRLRHCAKGIPELATSCKPQALSYKLQDKLGKAAPKAFRESFTIHRSPFTKKISAKC